MKLQKLIHIFFMSAIAIAMSACVPKVTEKKAVCGTNQAFNSVTRSCYSIVAPNVAPTVSNFSLTAFNSTHFPIVEDDAVESVVTLPYTDIDFDQATVCQVSALSNIYISTACTCAAGVCTVGIKPSILNYYGAAQFSYSVKTNNMISNTAVATPSISAVNDAPTIAITTLPVLPETIANQFITLEDTSKIINFTIVDVDNTLSCTSSVSVTSSNAAIIPVANIVKSQISSTGSIHYCALNISPVLNQSDIVTPVSIVITVTDSATVPLSNTAPFTLLVDPVNDRPVISTFIPSQATSEDVPVAITFAMSDVDSPLLDCTSAYLTVTSTSTNLLLLPVYPMTLISGVDVIFSGTPAACTATITPFLNQYGTAYLTFSVNDLSGSSTAIGQSNTPIQLTVNAVNDTPVISAILAQTTNEDVPVVVNFSISDVDITNILSCTSSVSVTTNSDPVLIPSSNIVFAEASQVGLVHNCTATITPAADKSSPLTSLAFTVTDGLIPVTSSFSLTVNWLNDVPYLNSTITTSDTNEGGVVVAGPFKIDEDQGSTTDEDDQSIQISSIVSDNQSVLTDATNPNSTSTIRIFYDLNDDGVENSGEERALSAYLEGPTALDRAKDVHGHSFYLKLYPVSGVAGNANVTITLKEYDAAGAITPNTITTNFSLIVHPVAALHGGWSNISAVGIKSDKTGAPVSVGDIQCNYNKSTDTHRCNSNQACTGTTVPHGTVIPDAVNVLFWDSANNKCYRSQSTSKFSWVDVTTTCPITRIFVAPTTLTTAVTAGSMTLTVASTAGFPDPAGVITIGTEQISYSAKTATTFTVSARGINSTPAVIHSVGAAISYTANGENFIEDPLATPAQVTPIATAKNQYYYNADTAVKSCFASVETSSGVWDWETAPYIPSKVKLSWNDFTVTGSGSDSSVQNYGWNVYRREAGQDYDYETGYLKVGVADTMSVSDVTVKTFTDTTAVAGKVYYYLVRPIDNTSRHLTISTPEVFSEVRVLAPTENYAFVHRWMANQEVCNSMHMTTTSTKKVDPTHNYRCPYSGPGQVTIIGTNYYDVGKDMLVDISENGCPYTKAPECTANGCIGIGDPATLLYTATPGSVYYDRSAGSCWYRNGGAWVDVNSAVGAPLIAAKNIGTALNPPIVNITKANADLICSNRPTTSAVSFLGPTNDLPAPPIASVAPVAVHSLPTKKEYIAYSAGPVSTTDSVLTDMEQGFSLNVQSRCNSSNANGLEVAYTDSNIPSTSFIYSLPGTSASGIRSLYTGSVPWVSNFSTETCSSRYGIQDVYGNVAEWVRDTMTCTGAGASAFVCDVSSGTEFGDYDFLNGVYNAAAADRYKFNLSTGPYNDVDATSTPTAGDGFLDTWDFRDELYGAGKFSFPMGMPIYVDIATPFPAAPSLPYFLDIGPTAGITTSQLHEDGIKVNEAAVNNLLAIGNVGNPNGYTPNPTQTGSFAQGGSYLSGNFSGRYSSEVVPDADVRPDVGFRCYIPIDTTNFPRDPGRHTYSY